MLNFRSSVDQQGRHQQRPQPLQTLVIPTGQLAQCVQAVWWIGVAFRAKLFRLEAPGACVCALAAKANDVSTRAVAASVIVSLRMKASCCL